MSPKVYDFLIIIFLQLWETALGIEMNYLQLYLGFCRADIPASASLKHIQGAYSYALNERYGRVGSPSLFWINHQPGLGLHATLYELEIQTINIVYELQMLLFNIIFALKEGKGTDQNI